MHLHFDPSMHRPPDPVLSAYAKDAAEEYVRIG